MLLPLDPDEVSVEEKPRSTRIHATPVAATLVAATLVGVAMLAPYLFWGIDHGVLMLGHPGRHGGWGDEQSIGEADAASPLKSAGHTSEKVKETIAHLTALISKKDFATAMNSAITFCDNHPWLAKTHGSEYRELLKLQRTATEKYFISQASSGRLPTYDTGDLDVATIDHDLMDSYLRAAMPTLASEYFLNAEQGYNQVLSVARQRERTASGGSSAKRDIQKVTENLGLLYASWAQYEPDVSILRKADAAFFDSERLLDYAEDPASAKRRVIGGRASIERIRHRLR